MNNEEKKTLSAFQLEIQKALDPILDKYLQKGTDKGIVIIASDGSNNSSALVGAMGNTELVIVGIQSAMQDPTTAPLFNAALSTIKYADMKRSINGAHPECNCPGCTDARNKKQNPLLN